MMTVITMVKKFLLLSALASFLLAPKVFADRKACEILLFEGQDYGIERFPEKIEFNYTRLDLEKFYRFSEELWRNDFDMHQVEAIIRDVAKAHAFTEIQAQQYKLYRGRLKQLRFAFRLFDKGHKYPEYLHQVTKLMGLLKDALLNDKFNVADRVATNLLELFEGQRANQIQHELAAFHPCTTKNFKAYLKSEINWLAETNKRPAMSAKKFHGMRNVMARLLSFFKIVYELTPNEANLQLVEFLESLNAPMGDFHNLLVQKSFNREIRYNDTKVKIPKKIREQIDRLVEGFEKLLD